MKTIILITSIFYILGLIVSQKIDVVKKSVAATKISTVDKLIKPELQKSITLKEGMELVNTKDSAKK